MNKRQKKRLDKNRRTFALMEYAETINLIMIKKCRGEILSKKEKKLSD